MSWCRAGRGHIGGRVGARTRVQRSFVERTYMFGGWFLKFLQNPWFRSVVAAVVVSSGAACTATSVTGPGESPAKCQVALTVPSQALSANGGSGSLSVLAAAECQWTASTNATWISGVSPASGQ
jgi:hypothetical protein